MHQFFNSKKMCETHCKIKDKPASARGDEGQSSGSVWRKIVSLGALVSLIVAFIAGYYLGETDLTASLKGQFAGKQIVKIGAKPPFYEIRDGQTGRKEGELIITDVQGWGGPMKVATVVDDVGTVTRMAVLSHKETPSFFQSLEGGGFFEQFSGLHVASGFRVGEDIQAVSGATISSRAVADGVRRGAHWTGRNRLDLTIDEPEVKWQLRTQELVLMGFFALVIVASRRKYRKLRLFSLGFGLVFLGFYMKSPLSMANFTSLLLGYFPSFHGHPFWWILVGGVLLTTVLMGRNRYCSWMCPFGALQEFLTLLGGIKMSPGRAASRKAGYLVYFLFWLSLMITLLTRNPGLGTFEPFGTLFSFKGIGIQWYLLLGAVFGAFIIPRFWCRFFCPVGFILVRLARVRGSVLKALPKRGRTINGKSDPGMPVPARAENEKEAA